MEELERKKEFVKHLRTILRDHVFMTENKDIAFQCLLFLGSDYLMHYSKKTFFFTLNFDIAEIELLLQPINDPYVWTNNVHRILDALKIARVHGYNACNAIGSSHEMLADLKDKEYEARLIKDEEIRAKIRRY